MNADVARVLKSYPPSVRKKLEAVRQIIQASAAADESVGPLTETLKWGEPAYLTEESGSGSTIRMGWKSAQPDTFAIYLNCRTTLVDDYRTLFPELKYDGNRAILFDVSEALPEATIEACIQMALTYHLTKKRMKRRAQRAE